MVWLLGSTGFTARYLLPLLKDKGYGVNEDKVDITNAKAVEIAVLRIKPNYIINLAGISFVPDGGSAEIYAINTFGPENILNACLKLENKPEKIILASSSHIYGEQIKEVIDERCLANPINHYGCSKWAMEQMAKNYQGKLDILITRPFNYTGHGQAGKFLIPKIVQHFKNKEHSISLGNIDIWRDFSDVRWVAEIYMKLMLLPKKSEIKITNICSGQLVSIREIISMLENMTGHKLKIEKNPQFIRASDMQRQKGSTAILQKILPSSIPVSEFSATLQWMLESN